MEQTINFCNLYLKKNLQISYLKKKLVKVTMENETLNNIFLQLRRTLLWSPSFPNFLSNCKKNVMGNEENVCGKEKK